MQKFFDMVLAYGNMFLIWKVALLFFMWFVAPVFPMLPILTYWQIAGISFFIATMSSISSPSNFYVMKRMDDREITQYHIASVIATLFVWGMGAILKFWIM